MPDLVADLRRASRSLIKNPGFTIVVALTLGLGFAVNTLIFSFVSFFVLRPLPIRDIERLVMVWGSRLAEPQAREGVSYPDFAEWRAQAKTVDDLAVFTRTSHSLSGSGDAVRITAHKVTANLFGQWQLQTAAGRFFSAEEDRPGAASVAVLAHRFWSSRFGLDPSAIGRSINIDGVPTTIVGVVKPEIEIGGFSEIDVWLPLAGDPASDRALRNLRVTGLLRPGTSVEQVHAELAAIAQRQANDHAESNRGWSARVEPLRTSLMGQDNNVVMALLSLSVGLVLLVASANVANLILARNTRRERDTALRLALGASRTRLIREGIVEGMLLAGLACALGLTLAAWGLRVIRAVTFEQFFDLVTIDWRVATFSLALSLLSPLLFGILPAVAAARADLIRNLREGSGSVLGGGRSARGRRVLVVSQLAMALGLVLTAGLAARSSIALHNFDLGYDYQDLTTVKVTLPDARYPDAAARRRFADDLVARLSEVPGVASVATGTHAPVLDRGRATALEIDGMAPPPPGQPAPAAALHEVGSGFFTTTGIAILRGRAIGLEDGPTTAPVAVASQTFVKRYLASAEPIGSRIRLPGAEAWTTIVGVARDIGNVDLRAEAPAYLYVSAQQDPPRTLLAFVRAREQAPVAAGLRKAVATLDPDVAADVASIRRTFFEDLASNRLLAGMFTTFAIIALIIAAVGLYGVVSYAVSQRTREIGVRVALGASRGNVFGLVFRESGVLLAIGLALGTGFGALLGRGMASVLYGVRPSDPANFSTSIVALALVGLASVYFPARRAARVDPLVALRTE